MICYVFRPKRRVAGKVQAARLYSGRVRLDGWLAPKTIPLHVTDKRVAEQKLRGIVHDLEREAAGVGVSRRVRDAARMPLEAHFQAFLDDLTGRGRAPATLKQYRKHFRLITEECGWRFLRDVTAQSFTDWRTRTTHSPKSVNDRLGTMRTFLNWLVRAQTLLANPLTELELTQNTAVGEFRRALSVQEIERLLKVAPTHRRAIYIFTLYTGLRRRELIQLRWGDFDLEATPPRLSVPAAISKNRKAAVIYLRPEAVDAVREIQPDLSMPFEWAFRGRVPSVRKLREDLSSAKIPYEDERGRRVDFHAVRTTFGTMLSAAGISPRVAMELMRHSDIRLTMRIYTDSSQLPLAAEVSKLPSFGNTQMHTQGDAQSGVVVGE